MATYQPIDYWSPNNFTFHAAFFTAETSNGVATFYLTKDGTPEGEAIFRNVFNLQATARENTSSAIEVPYASIKEISSDLKTVTVNVTKGILLLTFGNTVEFSPDGTRVDLHVIGD